MTGWSSVPGVYWQGVANDATGRNLFFDGIFVGLYRTTATLRQTVGVPDAIPPAVRAGEGYNHIGDIAWDRRERGRILLPLECYYPGRPGDANTCKTGSFGVADPRTLAWRYYVKLDPGQIPKAMWAATSPDGLVWTSSGNDLLAYRTRDVAPANAAPAARPIRAVRRLRAAVPPSGVTGAVFTRGRLLLAGEDEGRFQVWSVDLRTGRRRLEIEQLIAGESEGLAAFDRLGGELHWVIAAADARGRRPTYGPESGLLHFVPARRGGLRVRVRPGSATAGGRARFVVRVRRGRRAVAGARVDLAGERARTNRRGLATLALRFERPGRYRALARKGRRQGLSRRVTVAAPRAAAGSPRGDAG
jgi:hypothetical protein